MLDGLIAIMLLAGFGVCGAILQRALDARQWKQRGDADK